MVTMEDVARTAGVSLTTVSHVLNETRNVRPATAAAVRHAVELTGYVPNTLARALAGANSNTIGVAISAISNHYFSEMVRSIEAVCSDEGQMMFFVDTHDDPAHEIRVVQSLHRRQVDGIILAPSADPERRAIRYLEEMAVPTVLVDRSVESAFDQVSVEGRGATAEMIAHLVGHGHKRIGFVSGSPGLTTTVERLAGYKSALRKAKLPYDAALVRCGHSEIEASRAGVRELLELPSPPTAIMAANGLMTIGATHALREVGVPIPRGMALVGFDDFEWAEDFHPRLTVVSQPLEEVGSRAIALLLERIRQRTSRESQSVRLKPTIVIRESCGCHPGDRGGTVSPAVSGPGALERRPRSRR